MVPKKNLIIETLYDPARSGIFATVDVILIHGLNGDCVGTWTHETSRVCWPRDLLPQVLPNARVLSFAYNADIYGNSSIAGIRGNASALLARLRDIREGDCTTPIIFVAHSLGGIILKQALYTAHIDYHYAHLLSTTRGLLLYSTPHFGADQSRWLSIAETFAPFGRRRFGRKGRHSQLVNALTQNSLDISNICEDFRGLASSLAIVSFYETRTLPGTSAVVVDKMSALMHLEHEESVPLDANHINICRFADSQDWGFKITSRCILRFAESWKLKLDTGNGQRIG